MSSDKKLAIACAVVPLVAQALLLARHHYGGGDTSIFIPVPAPGAPSSGPHLASLPSIVVEHGAVWAIVITLLFALPGLWFAYKEWGLRGCAAGVVYYAALECHAAWLAVSSL